MGQRSLPGQTRVQDYHDYHWRCWSQSIRCGGLVREVPTFRQQRHSVLVSGPADSSVLDLSTVPAGSSPKAKPLQHMHHFPSIRRDGIVPRPPRLPRRSGFRGGIRVPGPLLDRRLAQSKKLI